jgi:hypothetical protein
LHDIETCINNLAKVQLNQKQVLFHLTTIFVSENSSTLQFICLPIQYADDQIALKDLYKSIITSAKFDATENSDYRREFIQILNTGLNFSEVEMSRYVKRITGATSNESGELVGNRRSPEPIKRSYNPLYSGELTKPEIATVISRKTTAEVSANPKQGTSLLGGTVTSPENATYTDPLAQNAILARADKSKVIMLDQPTFYIGKEADNSYAITDNDYVSAHHATILKRNGVYFLSDNQSTNGTFINNIRLNPNTEVKLEDGMHVKFANDEYIFDTRRNG